MTILGANFTAGSSVVFGSTPATAVGFVSTSKLSATTAAHLPGTVDVTVTNPGGQSGTLPGGFTYVCATPPAALVSGSVTLCPGQSTTLSLSLSGTAPFAFQWSDGVAQSGVTTGSVTRVVSPAVTTTYSIKAFHDTACEGSVSGSATVTIDSDPTCGSFYTVPPCRVVDTRNPPGPFGGPAITAGEERVFLLASSCGIPSTAKAISLNVTVVGSTTAGFLTLQPDGLPIVTSTISYLQSAQRSNNAVIRLGPGSTLAVTSGQTTGTVQLILDVNGYFQ